MHVFEYQQDKVDANVGLCRLYVGLRGVNLSCKVLMKSCLWRFGCRGVGFSGKNFFTVK